MAVYCNGGCPRVAPRCDGFVDGRVKTLPEENLSNKSAVIWNIGKLLLSVYFNYCAGTEVQSNC